MAAERLPRRFWFQRHGFGGEAPPLCLDQEKRDYCRDCQYGFRKKAESAPWSTCEWEAPELIPENTEALSFWLEIQTQWRVGMSGPTGLDYPALYLEAERLEVDLSNCLMKKIKALERQTLTRLRDNRDAQSESRSPGDNSFK